MSKLVLPFRTIGWTSYSFVYFSLKVKTTTPTICRNQTSLLLLYRLLFSFPTTSSTPFPFYTDTITGVSSRNYSTNPLRRRVCYFYEHTTLRLHFPRHRNIPLPATSPSSPSKIGIISRTSSHRLRACDPQASICCVTVAPASASSGSSIDCRRRRIRVSPSADTTILSARTRTRNN
ncbi:hypothetical protein BT63DRAFT_200041 [Microthyrium microscopicum]|uniref:Uncharacterized protein n=1 Tax=Microthyrium microscopicum TaxID=703497 RepID=A0A6A6UH15_9PEZI|nr:hypothetical protein BT63DRAFT_200041 [Microthyrium microscopicum]